MKPLLRLSLPIIVVAFLASCGGDDDDPMMPPAAEAPPNLTGMYTLQTLTAPVTGDLPLGPPIATGTFTLSQDTSSGDTATGSLDLSVTILDPSTGQPAFQIMEQGTYTVRTDGGWEQSSQTQQARGTYTLAGNVLTVIVTEPLIAVSTTVWQRQ